MGNNTGKLNPKDDLKSLSMPEFQKNWDHRLMDLLRKKRMNG